MVLREEAAGEFIQLHAELMLFAGQEAKLLPKKITVSEVLDVPLEELIEYRDLVYQDITVVDRYVKQNEKHLTDQQRTDALGFKEFVSGTFHLVKHYKKYTVLMDEDRLYGVLGLTQPISDIVPKEALPVMVKTVILPFRGNLVYDGFLRGSNVYFGSGYRRSINEDFKRIKAISGITDTLTAANSLHAPADRTAELEKELRFILNSYKRWEEQVYRVEDILAEAPRLNRVFRECTSKLFAKRAKKRLKALGVSGRYFAVYHDCVLASATSRKALEEELQTITLDGNVEDCAIFKL